MLRIFLFAFIFVLAGCSGNCSDIKVDFNVKNMNIGTGPKKHIKVRLTNTTSKHISATLDLDISGREEISINTVVTANNDIIAFRDFLEHDETLDYKVSCN